MYLAKITIENFRGFGAGTEGFELKLKPGLVALVGENDSGKSAVIDALRFALGTTDNDWYRIEDTDFYGENTKLDIKIVCKFEKLSEIERGAFLEYLTFDEEAGEEPVLYVNWTAKTSRVTRRGRRYYTRPETRSGKNGSGSVISQEVRDLLRATYLQPLRDAELGLSAGRGSRLSQVLQNIDEIKKDGNNFDRDISLDEVELDKLNVLGIGDLSNKLLTEQEGIVNAKKEIDEYLEKLSLKNDSESSDIKISDDEAPEDVRLRRLLEKFNLSLKGNGKQGLGSNNLLFMACEYLLLSQESECNRLLLIEEPEAHLHTQRQLQVMTFLQEQAKEKGIQVIVTTHSPNLASAINLENIVILKEHRAFSLEKEQTELSQSDYGFLERFLDVTKANLFFARGVMIVEGDAENILLPTLAKLIGRDLTKHGVSIVNVGGVGLHRYAKIFRRKGVAENNRNKWLNIPVACVTDLDVMPDCAPGIIGKIKENEPWPEKNNRRWRVKGDIKDIDSHRTKIKNKASGQNVRTFISDEWTLEYDLALGQEDDQGNFCNGLPQEVYIAACLAKHDDAINDGKQTLDEAKKAAQEAFKKLEKNVEEGKDNCSREEVIATKVYAKFAKDGVSKAVAAQYLAGILQDKDKGDGSQGDELRRKLPKYLIEAIDYVTDDKSSPRDKSDSEEASHE